MLNHSTPRRGIKTEIKTALTQAERSQTVEKCCDCPENQISVAAERQKQIPINICYKGLILYTWSLEEATH
jgi:hypothetical protein